MFMFARVVSCYIAIKMSIYVIYSAMTYTAMQGNVINVC